MLSMQSIRSILNSFCTFSQSTSQVFFSIPSFCFLYFSAYFCHKTSKNSFNAVCLLIFRCRSVILYYEKNSKKIISDSYTYFFDCYVAAWSGVCRQAIWRCVFQSFSGQLLCVRWRSGFTSGRQKNTLAVL